MDWNKWLNDEVITNESIIDVPCGTYNNEEIKFKASKLRSSFCEATIVDLVVAKRLDEKN